GKKRQTASLYDILEPNDQKEMKPIGEWNSAKIVAKGSKVSTFKTAGKAGSDCIDAMLGPTGNLRAPALIVGKTVVVGFHEDTYRAVLG
ncbi:MAG: hypothetical protein ABR587_06440, partial [Candidatus Binatia bacterium]